MFCLNQWHTYHMCIMHTLTCHLSICVQGDFGVQYECLSLLYVKSLSSDQWRGTTRLMKTFVCYCWCTKILSQLMVKYKKAHISCIAPFFWFLSSLKSGGLSACSATSGLALQCKLIHLDFTYLGNLHWHCCINKNNCVKRRRKTRCSKCS